MTYNVHRCRGLDRVWSPERIAAVITSAHPDVVALQEVDVGRSRSGNVDQALSIARALGMDVHFFPALKVMEELYGDAILSRWPAKIAKAETLPYAKLPGLEPRGALWSSVCIRGVSVQVINTHLSLLGRERNRQVDALMGDNWLEHLECRGPVILLGDFNATPRSRTYRRITQSLRDAYDALDDRNRSSEATFPTRYPSLRLDYIFVNSQVNVLDVRTVRSPLAYLASDHLPVVAELAVSSSHATGGGLLSDLPGP